MCSDSLQVLSQQAKLSDGEMIFKDIESYLEFMGGYRDQTGKQAYIWATHIQLKLATYDIGFVASGWQVVPVRGWAVRVPPAFL